MDGWVAGWQVRAGCLLFGGVWRLCVVARGCCKMPGDEMTSGWAVALWPVDRKLFLGALARWAVGEREDSVGGTLCTSTLSTTSTGALQAVVSQRHSTCFRERKQLLAVLFSCTVAVQL
jgi:hypothetical protein